MTLTHNHYRVSITSDASSLSPFILSHSLLSFPLTLSFHSLLLSPFIPSYSLLSFSLTLTTHAWLLRLVHMVIYIVKKEKKLWERMERENEKRRGKKRPSTQFLAFIINVDHHHEAAATNTQLTHSTLPSTFLLLSLSLSLSRFSFFLSLASLSFSLLDIFF